MPKAKDFPSEEAKRRVMVGAIGACVHNLGVEGFADWMADQGLYSVSADGSNLKPVSEDKIPEDLTNVSDSDCNLTYDHSTRGVSIHKTTAPSWFYDIARDGFWPFDMSTTNSHVLLGPFQLGQGNNYGRVLQLHGNIAASSPALSRLIMSRFFTRSLQLRCVPTDRDFFARYDVRVTMSTTGWFLQCHADLK